MTVEKTNFTWIVLREGEGPCSLLHLLPTEPEQHELVGWRCWCEPQEYHMQGVDMILHTPSIALEIVPNHLPHHL